MMESSDSIPVPLDIDSDAQFSQLALAEQARWFRLLRLCGRRRSPSPGRWGFKKIPANSLITQRGWLVRDLGFPQTSSGARSCRRLINLFQNFKWMTESKGEGRFLMVEITTEWWRGQNR